jgi:hypothetical protein
MGFMRDHFEDTEFDMTRDIGAGPYELPYRWRPLTWKVDDKEYLHERAVSTQQTAFSFVSQSREHLPPEVGGVLWFGVDDTYSTVYFPAYCGMTRVPHGFAVGTGSFRDFTWDSGFWVFNFVSNFCYLRYRDMIQDVQGVQRELEGRFLADQAAVEEAAVALHRQSPRLAIEYLTNYSVQAGDDTVKRWRELGEALLVKYLDGNVRDSLGNVTHPGYPEAWYAKVAAAAGTNLEVSKLPVEQERERTEQERDTKLISARARAIVTLLRERDVAISQGDEEKIQKCQDAARLGRWLIRAATAESSEECLADD